MLYGLPALLASGSIDFSFKPPFFGRVSLKRLMPGRNPLTAPIPSRQHVAAMKQPKIRIGIVGAGGIVLSRHLPALRAMPNVEIVAVSNSSYASSERFCREHLPHATPIKNWADLVALPDLDVVWIGTPPSLHAPVSISALEAGRHVFCQARMAMNLREAVEMLEAARRRLDRVTALCPPPFGMKGDAVVRQWLNEGRIGKPLQVRLRSLNGLFADPSTPAHWRQRYELSGLNILSLGIYVEVLQRWLGPIQAVTARGRVVHPYREGYQVRIPDFVNVLAEFENGAEGVLEFSGVATAAPGDQVEIYGESGMLRYEMSTDAIFAARDRENTPQPVEIPPEMAKPWTVERDFITAVTTPTAPRPAPSFEEGVRYMRVVQAVADSLASGERVSIDLGAV